VTCVGLEIIGKFAEVLRVDPAEFFKTPARTHRKSPGHLFGFAPSLATSRKPPQMVTSETGQYPRGFAERLPRSKAPD
jgi:hypothetical protein